MLFRKSGPLPASVPTSQHVPSADLCTLCSPGPSVGWFKPGVCVYQTLSDLTCQWYSTAVRGSALRARLCGFKSPLYTFLAVQTWPVTKSSLYLSFSNCRMGMLLIVGSKDQRWASSPGTPSSSSLLFLSSQYKLVLRSLHLPNSRRFLKVIYMR